MKAGDRVRVTGCHRHGDECQYHNREGMVLRIEDGNVAVEFSDDSGWFYADELTVIEEGNSLDERGLMIDEEEAIRWAIAYCADTADATPSLLFQQRAKALRSLLSRLTKGGV